MSKIKLIALLLLSSRVATAQISLEEYRQQVIDFSYELQLSDERISSAQSSYELSQRALMPSLSIDGSFLQLLDANFGSKSWDFNLYPKITQVIYSGGALRCAIKQADIYRDIELCSALFTRSEIEYTADYTYWNLVAMKHYRQVAEEYYNTILSLEEVVSMRYQEGYVAMGDLLMMQTRLAEASYSRRASEQSYTVALQNFNTLRGGIDIDEEVELTSQDSDSELPLRVTLSEVLKQRADYTSSLLSEEYSKMGIDLAKSSYNPTLSFGVQAMWQPYAPNITGETYFSGLLFANLSIPVFNFGARSKAVDVARRSYKESQLNSSILNLSITKEEANAWTTLSNQYAQMGYTKESLTIASTNLEISTYSYQEGLTTIVDVMSAQVSWLQLFSNAIASEFAYMVAVAEYRKVTGVTSPY